MPTRKPTKNVPSLEPQVTRIKSLLNTLTSHKRAEIATSVKVGEELGACRNRLKHGTWLPWLKENFEMSETTARNFMKLHLLSKTATVAEMMEAVLRLKVPLRFLYTLSPKKLRKLPEGIAMPEHIRQLHEEALRVRKEKKAKATTPALPQKLLRLLSPLCTRLSETPFEVITRLVEDALHEMESKSPASHPIDMRLRGRKPHNTVVTTAQPAENPTAKMATTPPREEAPKPKTGEVSHPETKVTSPKPLTKKDEQRVQQLTRATFKAGGKEASVRVSNGEMVTIPNAPRAMADDVDMFTEEVVSKPSRGRRK